jgi:putative ABC transport system substrate-binding protein
MRRRDFIIFLAGAMTAWPLVGRAQQKAMPVIGVLGSGSADPNAHLATAFIQGLREGGYAEGQNVAIEYRWADNQYDRLPGMAAELIRHPVALILASGGPASVLAAKRATSTMPIVFPAMSNPVELGLVSSLSRPGGNITGIAALTIELDAKRLELLHDLVPPVERIGVLVNPNRPASETQVREIEAAGRTLGQQLIIVRVGGEGDFDPGFAMLKQQGAGALMVSADPFFTSSRERIVALAARHALPAVYQWRDFAVAGGLLSYGASLANGYRIAGNYAGKILNGAKPADLPVQQPTKFELVINLKTAKALGLTVPQSLLARADEVIE